MNKTTYIFLFRNKQNMILQYKKKFNVTVAKTPDMTFLLLSNNRMGFALLR